MNINRRFPMSGSTVKKPYKVGEFARLADLSPNAVYELVRRGELPSVRFGRAIRLPADPCDRMLRGESASVDKAA